MQQQTTAPPQYGRAWQRGALWALLIAIAVSVPLAGASDIASASERPDRLTAPPDPSRCGDGELDPGEECDAPATTCAAPCKADCTCDFSNCCRCEDSCTQGFFCPVECPPIAGGLCTRAGSCALPCPCGATCTTLDGVVGSCQSDIGAAECVCQPPGPPPLPRDLALLARQLESVPLADDSGDDTPVPTAGEAGLPAIGLRHAMVELERLVAAADRKTERLLRRASESVQDAWHHYAAGAADLSHLGETTEALRRAEASLGIAALLASRAGRADLERIEAQLSGLARRMASDVLRVAGAAGGSRRRLALAQRLFALGDLAAARGSSVIAVGLFGGALNLAADTIVFDVARFEQNINAPLASQTTGYAFSIAYQGQLYQGGESGGLARTAADPPLTAQSPGKEMHVASVSKTLTTIVTLRLLEDLGLTPDALIAPYLPSDWALGDGVELLTFRDFMTHTSGFGQINAGNDYLALRTAIATDVGSQSFSYKNANFGLMRVLAAGLQGIDPVDYGEFDAGTLTTAAFLLYAQFLYGSIGVAVDCAPTDATPTVQYKFPDDGTPGYVEPNRQLSCGGFGWFISSNELAAVLTNLRHAQTLLSTSARTAMQEGFLGFMDPANYSFIGGAFGVYSMHGGDWYHSNEELHSCVIAFPIAVEAALVINSARGGGMPYQCALLQSAFDNAWVAN